MVGSHLSRRRLRVGPVLVAVVAVAGGCVDLSASSLEIEIWNNTDADVEGSVRLLRGDGTEVFERTFRLTPQETTTLDSLTSKVGSFDLVVEVEDGRAERQGVTIGGLTVTYDVEIAPKAVWIQRQDG